MCISPPCKTYRRLEGLQHVSEAHGNVGLGSGMSPLSSFLSSPLLPLSVSTPLPLSSLYSILD